jgi:hypothetical protein
MTCQAPYLLVKATIIVELMTKDLGHSLEIYFLYIYTLHVGHMSDRGLKDHWRIGQRSDQVVTIGYASTDQGQGLIAEHEGRIKQCVNSNPAISLDRQKDQIT